MIKWPDHFGYVHAGLFVAPTGGHDPKFAEAEAEKVYTEAQLKQAVRDFGEQCEQLADQLAGRCLHPDEIASAIRALIKEVV